MSMDPSRGSSRPRGPSTDAFWPRFWFNVCRYSEYYFMMLIAVTMFAVLNGIAMLLAPQSTAAFVISVLVFVILGITALSIAVVLLQCRKMRAPQPASGEE